MTIRFNNAKELIEVIEGIEKEYSLVGYGFAHIVLGDYNYDHNSIMFCFSIMQDYISEKIQEIEPQDIPYDLYKLLDENAKVYDLLIRMLNTDESILNEAMSVHDSGEMINHEL